MKYCVRRFDIDEKLFKEAIELARTQYIDKHNEEIPWEIYDLKLWVYNNDEKG